LFALETNLASVTYESAGRDSDVTHRQAGLIANTRGNLEEAPGIRKIRL
jgi:hypothetical protein